MAEKKEYKDLVTRVLFNQVRTWDKDTYEEMFLSGDDGVAEFLAQERDYFPDKSSDLTDEQLDILYIALFEHETQGWADSAVKKAKEYCFDPESTKMYVVDGDPTVGEPEEDVTFETVDDTPDEVEEPVVEEKEPVVEEKEPKVESIPKEEPKPKSPPKGDKEKGIIKKGACEDIYGLLEGGKSMTISEIWDSIGCSRSFVNHVIKTTGDFEAVKDTKPSKFKLK